MSLSRRTSLTPMTAILLCLSAFSAAATTGGEARGLTPRERGDLARQFVLKWGGYAQRVYGVKAGPWAMRLVPTFVAAKPSNFRNALKRETIEGAMAELTGTGARLSDQQAIDLLARRATKSGAQMKLGDISRDLVYTPITPCRIVDTRNMVSGAIAANSARTFHAVARSSFADQGGSGTDCGTLSVPLGGALALNVAAVLPSAGGYATVYEYDPAATRPVAASLNYTANSVVNNTVVTKIGTLTDADFVIYTYAQSHYVVDVVGYYTYVAGTSLGCSTNYEERTIAANANFDFSLPSCSANASFTTGNCESAGFNQVNWASNGISPATGHHDTLRCAGTNLTSGTITVRGSYRCCGVGNYGD